MLLIPSVEVQGKQVVVTRRDDNGTLTKSVYSDDVLSVVRELAQLSADRIHIVDVEGALHGKTMDPKFLKSIINAIHEENSDIEIQVAGGIRTLDKIDQYLNMGIDFVVIGTGALKQPGFLADACSNFGGQVIFSIDVLDGKIMVDGWTHAMKNDIATVVDKACDNDLAGIIYTDVSRVGTLKGVNLEQAVQIAQSQNMPVYVMGGFASTDELPALCDAQTDGIDGLIIDRALTDKVVDFEEICDIVDNYEDSFED